MVSVVYVLGLQAAVFLIAKFHHSINSDFSKSCDESVAAVIMSDVWLAFGNDGGWIFDAIVTSLEKHQEVCNDRRMIRVPPTLMDGSFLSKLRNGEAIWLLQRLSFLTRLSKILTAALDSIIHRKSFEIYLYGLETLPKVSSFLIARIFNASELGPEELGKRGSPTRNSTELDLDMKAKLVTTEELSHAVGNYLGTNFTREIFCPAPWWDRSCHIALIIGTFTHGFGSYDSMSRDPLLPFSHKINSYTIANPCFGNVLLAFNSAIKEASNFVNAARGGSDKLLEPKEAKTNALNNGHVQMDSVQKNASSIGPVVDVLCKTFRASVSAEANSFLNAATIGESVQERRLMMPDAPVLDKLLISLVEIIEVNMGICFYPHSVGKTETSAFCFWELTENNTMQNIVAAPRNFRSKLVVLPSLHDASNYVHSSPLSLELEASSIETPEEKRERMVTLGLTRVGIAALLLSTKQSVCTLSEFLPFRSDVACPPSWINDKVLSQNICVALINVGSPLLSHERFTTVHVDVLRALAVCDWQKEEDTKFFTIERFLAMSNACNINCREAESYLCNILLPFCLRLAVCGNDTSVESNEAIKEKDPPLLKKVVKRPGAVISEVEYNEDSVLSCYKEALSLQHLTHIPDPAVPLEAHSDEAIYRALAIIRR